MMREETTSISPEGYHLIDTIPLPGRDFDIYTRLLIPPAGNQIFVGGLSGKICLIQNPEKPTMSIMDPAESISTPPIRYGVDLGAAKSVDEAAETIASLADGIPGLYPSKPYAEMIDHVTSLDGSYDNTGLARNIVAISNNGFLLNWQRQNDGTFKLFRPEDMSGCLSFARTVRVLPRGDVAFSDLSSGKFQIVEAIAGQEPRLKMTYEIPDERWGRKIIHTFDTLEQGNEVLVAIGDSSEALHLIALNAKGNNYEVREEAVIENPTKKRYEELDEDRALKLSQVLSDPKVIWGSTEKITFRNKNVIAVAHCNGILLLRRDNDNAEWQYDIVKFGREEVVREDLGGCGRPRNIVFLADGIMAVAYEHGRVAIWSKVEDQWKAKIIRDTGINMGAYDIGLKNGKIYISGQNKLGHGVIEIYSDSVNV